MLLMLDESEYGGKECLTWHASHGTMIFLVSFVTCLPMRLDHLRDDSKSTYGIDTTRGQSNLCRNRVAKTIT